MSLNYADNRLNIIEGLIKLETTPGTDATPAAATDAVWLAMPGDTANMMPDQYGFSGDNGPNSVGTGPRQFSAPSQRSGTCDLPHFFQGPGIAYSSSVTALNAIHTIMKTCGYTATGTFTGGSEIWTYTPTGDATTPATATIYGFSRQQRGASTMRKSVITFGMGSLKCAASGLAPAIFTPSYRGIFTADPAEASFTGPTLAATPTPPNMAGAVFTVDGTALDLYNFSWDPGRDISSDRVAVTSAGGYQGSVAGGWMPKLKVQVEDKLLATWNPYTKRSSAATAAVVLTLGTVQYNKRTLNMATAQITNVTPSGKGKIGLMDVEFTGIPSTPAGNDHHTWVDS